MGYLEEAPESSRVEVPGSSRVEKPVELNGVARGELLGDGGRRELDGVSSMMETGKRAPVEMEGGGVRR